MEYVLLVIVLGVAACFGGRYFLLKRSINHITRDIQKVAGSLEENRKVKLPSPDKGVEALLEEINSLLENMRKEAIRFGNQEANLRSQIEFISHDLRTPLTSIQGYLSLIDASELDSEGLESIEVIQRKADSLQRLIVQFYELSQLENEREPLRVQSRDVSCFLKESLALYYHTLEERGFAVMVELPEHPVEAFVNDEALERIFANLLQNASRYAVSRLKVELVEKADQVEIVFQNNSELSGDIDTEQLFEPFYMHDNSRSQGGSGLGLAIARRLADGMGAHLEAQLNGADENPDIGFILTLQK